MSHHNFDEILNTCLDLLQQGATVKDCLDQFPDSQAELKPILELTAQMNAIAFEPPSVAARQKGKDRLAAAVDSKQSQKASSLSKLISFDQIRLLILSLFVFGQETHPMTRFTRSAFAGVLVIFSFFFTLNASADSLPGDMLYPIKTLSQQARIQLAAPENKTDVFAQIAATRIAELDMLMIDGRSAVVTLDGPVTLLDDNTIMVEGFEIKLTADTVRHFDFDNGDFIKITVELANGTLTALDIDESDLAPTDEIVETPTSEPTVDPTVDATETVNAEPTEESTVVPEPTETAVPGAYPYPSPSPDHDNDNGNDSDEGNSNDDDSDSNENESDGDASNDNDSSENESDDDASNDNDSNENESDDSDNDNESSNEEDDDDNDNKSDDDNVNESDDDSSNGDEGSVDPTAEPTAPPAPTATPEPAPTATPEPTSAPDSGNDNESDDNDNDNESDDNDNENDSDDDKEEDNSGSGSGDDREEEDNSGSGSGDDREEEEDSSGSGSGDERDDDD